MKENYSTQPAAGPHSGSGPRKSPLCGAARPGSSLAEGIVDPHFGYGLPGLMRKTGIPDLDIRADGAAQQTEQEAMLAYAVAACKKQTDNRPAA
jgi:hypothetical protein